MARTGAGRLRLFAVTVIALAALLLLLDQGGSSGEGDWGLRVTTLAPSYLDRDPGRAARMALAGDRLDPSEAAQFSMLAVAADSAGVERVIETGSARVTAAIRTTHLVLIATADGRVVVWRPHGGVLLGEAHVASPLVAFADSPSTAEIAAVDAHGGLSLVDLSDPLHPRVSRLARRAGSARDGVLALSFSAEAVTVLVVTAAGEIERFDTTTGALLERWSLGEVSGAAPWGSRRPAVVAAAFDSQYFSTTERLLVAIPNGAVVRVELRRRRIRTMIPPGFAPGRITSVAENPYGPDVVAGATGGLVTSETRKLPPTISTGPEATGVAFAEGETLWIGDQDGIRSEQEYFGAIREEAASGRPVRLLSAGIGGVVALNPGGAVSLLGPLESGLSLPETEATTFAAFDPEGHVVLPEGSPGYVYQLAMFRPGHGLQDGEPEPDPEVRSYEPDPKWWSEESEHGLFVDAVAAGGGLVAAGGQDPTGQAVVLVWDAKSGRPLRRLPLSTGGIRTLEPSVVSGIFLLPREHLLLAYSGVQQLVAVWSTESWRLLHAIPVGSLRALAVDPGESRLAVVSGPPPLENEFEEEATAPEKLIAIDPVSGQIEHEATVADVADIAYSPDGRELALATQRGALRILSADSAEPVRSAIPLESQPVAIAWHPDGRQIAVAFEDGGISLVDPETGLLSESLPHELYGADVMGLEWSADGRFLLVSRGEPAESGEGDEPAPAQLWAVQGPRLRRRMCQLAGSSRPVCGLRLRPPRAARNEDAPPERAGLAFRRGDGIFASDLEHPAARIGGAGGESFYQAVAFSWLGDGLGWAGHGDIGLLRDGARRADVWPCACSGLAARGDALFSLESEGERLFRFSSATLRPRTIELDHRPGHSPRLLGFLGRRAVVAGYATPQERATPSSIYLVDPDGQVSRFPDGPDGQAYGPVAESSSGQVLAFTTTLSGGVCYSPSTIGILTLDRRGAARAVYPPMPGGDEPQQVRSLGVNRDGLVTAAIAPLCEGETPGRAPPNARRYVLRGERWTPQDEPAGFDVQAANGFTASISRPAPYSQDGTLTLRRDAGSPEEVAEGVGQILLRPW